jgi:hypothetical protein
MHLMHTGFPDLHSLCLDRRQADDRAERRLGARYQELGAPVAILATAE